MPYADYQQHLARMREYAKTPDGKAARLRANREYRRRNRHKLAAHNAVARALRNGALQRWPCEVCGHNESEAHHPAYSMPLLVTWLCDEHHKEVHRMAASEP
jgi:hypothetical protein